MLEILQQIPFFAQLPEAEQKSFARACHHRTFSKGQVIHLQGDPCTEAYILTSGCVKVSMQVEEGQEVCVDIRRPNEVFGIMGFFAEKPRICTAIALRDSGVLMFRREDFLALLGKRPNLMMPILTELDSRLYRWLQQVVNFCFMGVGDRVASKLLQLAEPDRERPGRLKILEGVTHQDLALMIGSTRETVTRVLQRMRQDRVLEVQNERMYLLRKDLVPSALAEEDKMACLFP